VPCFLKLDEGICDLPEFGGHGLAGPVNWLPGVSVADRPHAAVFKVPGDVDTKRNGRDGSVDRNINEQVEQRIVCR